MLSLAVHKMSFLFSCGDAERGDNVIQVKSTLSDQRGETPFVAVEPCEPAQFRVLLVYPNLPLMLVPPLSIAIFTGILKDNGYQLSLFETTAYLEEDATVSPENRVKLAHAREFDYERDLGVTVRTTDVYSDFRAAVLEFQPHVMIFSVVEDAFRQCIGLLKAVADLDIPHIIGGVFPTAAPDRCISVDEVKMIGIGEGEDTISLFCESIRQGQPVTGIPGTWVKVNGQLVKNPKGALVDIALQHPDFSLFDSRRFYRPMGGRIFRTVPIETYRGCPYKCTYCNSPMRVDQAIAGDQGNFLRRKPIPCVRNEIAALIERLNPEFLYFIDDSFLARPKSEIFAFCDMYEEFKIPFWFNTRPENCRLPEMQRLKEVGAYRISFGIECGNEEYRKKVLLRQVTNKQIIDSFSVIEESKIPFALNLIIGFPGETRALVMDTVELVRSIGGYDSLTVSIFTPYHGTRLRDVAVRNGWLDDSIITEHTTASSLLRMPAPYLSQQEIDGLMRVLPLYCYFPKADWAEIECAEREGAEGDAILLKFMDIYRREFLGENQEQKLRTVIASGTGCRASIKDSYFLSPLRLTEEQFMTLIP